MTIEAMKQALETLEHLRSHDKENLYGLDEDITALRTAIEQAEKQEPVCWFTEDHREDKSATTYSKKMAERWKEKGWPVTPLYTTPPAAPRQWVGLTRDEAMEIINSFVGQDWAYAVDAIEAKLKEKNG